MIPSALSESTKLFKAANFKFCSSGGSSLNSLPIISSYASSLFPPYGSRSINNFLPGFNGSSITWTPLEVLPLKSTNFEIGTFLKFSVDWGSLSIKGCNPVSPKNSAILYVFPSTSIVGPSEFLNLSSPLSVITSSLWLVVSPSKNAGLVSLIFSNI